jgi:hypothetical protein
MVRRPRTGPVGVMICHLTTLMLVKGA